MHKILRETSATRSPKKKMLTENVVDIAISIYEQFLINDSQNIPNIITIIDEMQFPHWNTIIEKIRTIWNKNYLNNIKILNNKGEIELHINKFDSEIKKLFSKRNEFIKWEKYFLYVINKEIDDIKSEVFEIEKPNIRRKSLRRSIKQNEQIEIVLETPKLIYLYEIKYMLRCHSVNGNPQDESTVIYDAAFEPCLVNKGKYTNICATSGGSIINFIDVSTGQVVKRFNEAKVYYGTKEKFYRLAWTVMNNMSILAAAGLHGDIKIIISQQSSCVMRINAHSKQIHSLCFHNKYPNILFSGSEDRTVQIWKLEIEDGNYRFGSLGQIKYISNENTKKSGPEAALTLLSFDNYLIISTVLNNYYVEFNDENFFEIIDYEDKNKRIYNAKLIKFIFGADIEKNFNTDEFIFNRIIRVIDNIILVNLTFSSSIFLFEAIKDNDDNLTFICKLNIQIGYKCVDLDPTIEFFEDNGSYYILKATDSGYFYKIELDKTTFERKSLLKFRIPTDYTIKTKNSSTSIPVRTHQLLENNTIVLKCVTNVDYVLTTCKNNLITIWSKHVTTTK